MERRRARYSGLMAFQEPRVFAAVTIMFNFFRPLRPSAMTLRAMSSSSSTPLVLSPSQAHALIQSKKPFVRLLDATWFMPNTPRNARQEFASSRLPGAQFLDLDDIASSHALGLKHMMPAERVFADACGTCGLLSPIALTYSPSLRGIRHRTIFTRSFVRITRQALRLCPDR